VGQRVRDHRAEHHRDDGRHHRHQQRVVSPRQEIRLVEQVDVVLERRLVDHQRHDLLAVQLAVRLDRRDEHPVERKQPQHDEHEQRDVQARHPAHEVTPADHR
jgi:hypothetical protein